MVLKTRPNPTSLKIEYTISHNALLIKYIGISTEVSSNVIRLPSN